MTGTHLTYLFHVSIREHLYPSPNNTNVQIAYLWWTHPFYIPSLNSSLVPCPIPNSERKGSLASLGSFRHRVADSGTTPLRRCLTRLQILDVSRGQAGSSSCWEGPYHMLLITHTSNELKEQQYRTCPSHTDQHRWLMAVAPVNLQTTTWNCTQMPTSLSELLLLSF